MTADDRSLAAILGQQILIWAMVPHMSHIFLPRWNLVWTTFYNSLTVYEKFCEKEYIASPFFKWWLWKVENVTTQWFQLPYLQERYAFNKDTNVEATIMSCPYAFLRYCGNLKRFCLPMEILKLMLCFPLLLNYLMFWEF